ncbi:MAG: hypothetical protein DRG24_03495 [Epsilonproteobacteria bacterium]|nr:MAG: hypothetical protein DRG24_03495 [Campylobacterota bacterium]
MHDIVVIALNSPLLIGIYQDGILIGTRQSFEKSSEILPELFQSILEEFDVRTVVYAKGPGSFMAIKISYIFLKTLSIVKDIRLLATDAFYFNGNRPIKAVGKLYFVKTSEGIVTMPFSEVQTMSFEMPNVLKLEDFTEETAPYYGIGAVG